MKSLSKELVLIAIALMLMAAPAAMAKSEPPQVKMETSKGVIVIQLNPQAAPKTTANFLSYVKAGFYDGTIFHRVIKGFMIQGGGMTPDMQKKTTQKPIANEADNGLKNTAGTIAMARTGDPHSATSQFFINTVDNHFLDHTAKTQRGWGYCVFGRVVQGMDVVREIEKVNTSRRAGHGDVPTEPVLIKKMTVVNAATPPKTDADKSPKPQD